MVDGSAWAELGALALATSAISSTIARAKVFAPLREWVKDRSPWLGKLISCSYCTSHYVAAGLVAIYRPFIVHEWAPADFVATTFAVVAISAVVSGVIAYFTFNETTELREMLEEAKAELEESDDE